jgi:hypothetical protein
VSLGLATTAPAIVKPPDEKKNDVHNRPDDNQEVPWHYSAHIRRKNGIVFDRGRGRDILSGAYDVQVLCIRMPVLADCFHLLSQVPQRNCYCVRHFVGVSTPTRFKYQQGKPCGGYDGEKK